MKILAFVGSLKKDSLNKKLLSNAIKLAPDGMEIEVFDLEGVPLYNKEIQDQGFPESVATLREKIKNADGVLIVTPEYNHSFSGVTKNAIDWISRPPEQPFNEKPIAMMSASDGGMGGVRAQIHLRAVFPTLNGFVMNRPQFYLSSADTKFDESGHLTDEADLEKLKKFMEAFANWIQKLS